MYTSFTFGTTEIPYILLRNASLKTVKIAVEFEHGVEVSAPAELDDAQLAKILRQKAPWILEKLRLLDEIAAPPPVKEFVSGEKFPLHGHDHTLIVEERAERKPFTVMRGGKLVVTVQPGLAVWDRRRQVRETLRAWYLRRAGEKLPEQLAQQAARLNVHPSKIEVLDLDRRWGSCTPLGAIHLNWRLVMSPPHIIDYLAVHELCHLAIPDHSPAFWALVAQALPDYEARREWLRVNGPLLTL